MQEYKGMKDARADYEKKAAQWQANADTLVTQWQDELKAYEKEHNSISKKERELKEELLRNKQQQINQYHEAIKLKMQDEDCTDPIENETCNTGNHFGFLEV